MIEPAKMHEALLKANIKLADWLEKKLVELDADYWQNLVVPKVSYNQKLNIDRKRYTKLRQLDLAVLLRVINKNWDDLSYKFNIEGRVRNYLNEVQDIRNRYAHMSDYPSAEDFARDVDTLARFLAGIGMDDDFVSQVKQIGKEQEAINVEPVIDSRQEPDCEESVDPDPSPEELTFPAVGVEKEEKLELPSVNEVKVLMRDSFAPGSALVKLKMRINGVTGYSSVCEVDGDAAKDLYLSLSGIPGVPILTGISYAIVAKQDISDATPIEDAKTKLDYVLAGDHIPGFDECIAQGEPDNRLIWLIGEKKMSAADSAVPLFTAPAVPRIYSCALPSWWSKMAREPQFNALPLLRIEEVQRTMKLSEVDLWRYMKTYAPRSWAESFYLVKTLSREALGKIVEAESGHISILDVGSGVGGALFGALDALALRVETNVQIDVVAIDGNDNALELLGGFLETRSKSPDPALATARDVGLTRINKTFAEELRDPSANVFDMIVASKSLGEDKQGAFETFLEYANAHLSKNGAVIIIEVLKHEQALCNALSHVGIKGAAVNQLEVMVGLSGEKSNDNEKVVTTVIYKNMF